MAGLGQPDIAGVLVVEMADVKATEAGGLSPSGIINQNNSFTLSTTFTFREFFAGFLAGQPFDVQHHIQRVDDGLNVKINGGTVVAGPPVAGQIVLPYTSVAITTGLNGSGANLEIPAGETEGTFRVLTELVAQDAFVRSIVSAFEDNLLLHVI